MRDWKKNMAGSIMGCWDIASELVVATFEVMVALVINGTAGIVPGVGDEVVASDEIKEAAVIESLRVIFGLNADKNRGLLAMEKFMASQVFFDCNKFSTLKAEDLDVGDVEGDDGVCTSSFMINNKS